MSPLAPLRALRQVRHERLKRAIELENVARVRSGTRDIVARKAVIAFEKKV
jgi:hypothetical protein